jgi:hypothetical protein
VTLAEQWNGNGPATGASDNPLGASPRTKPGPCARAFASASARPVSTWFRSRSVSQTPRASSRELTALQRGCRT